MVFKVYPRRFQAGSNGFAFIARRFQYLFGNYDHIPDKKRVYLYRFMAQDLYQMICPVNSAWDAQTRESGKTLEYVELLPYGSQEPRINGFETKKHQIYPVISYHTNDDVLF